MYVYERFCSFKEEEESRLTFFFFTTLSSFTSLLFHPWPIAWSYLHSQPAVSHNQLNSENNSKKRTSSAIGACLNLLFLLFSNRDILSFFFPPIHLLPAQLLIQNGALWRQTREGFSDRINAVIPYYYNWLSFLFPYAWLSF